MPVFRVFSAVGIYFSKKAKYEREEKLISNVFGKHPLPFSIFDIIIFFQRQIMVVLIPFVHFM